MADQPAEEIIELRHVEISPNNCPMEEALHLEMDFSTARDLYDARWVVSFLADSANSRKIVLLGETPVCDYATGDHTMSFDVSGLDVSHLKRHVVANVGLLQANLVAGDAEILQVSMVTQVNDVNGDLIRSVFSPLE